MAPPRILEALEPLVGPAEICWQSIVRGKSGGKKTAAYAAVLS